ncbi:MAG: hypothetical protein ACR2JB_21190 [Bryobacteraceae bacterium]
MATIPIPIRSIERRMRGGAQALLVRDGLGNAYVAKCVGNPQGTRTLINEWMVSRLLKHLRLSTPAVHTLRIERGIPGDSLLEFQVGNQKIPIEPGVHLGSVCPVDPARKAIFDLLPRRLLHNVVNLPDLILAFTFDKWVNQTDSRQAIFIRERAAGKTAKFRAYLIDHGLSFGGSRWELGDGALNGLYHDRSVYDDPAMEGACHAAVERIQQVPETSLLSLETEVPVEWLQPGDREEMTRLLSLLCERRIKLHNTVDRALRQLDEAGIVIPKTSDVRRLVGALLLLSCVPRPSSNTGLSIGIEIAATRMFILHEVRNVERWTVENVRSGAEIGHSSLT